jgi:hypothetical protein
MTEPLVDPTGFLLTSLRDDPGVVALNAPVRGGEPAGRVVKADGTVISEGDALGPGRYKRFIVLVRLGTTRRPHAPVQEVRYAARCYGATFQDAALMAGTVSAAIHDRGVRISPGGISILNSLDDGGEGAAKDPDTAQPYETVIVALGALTGLLP